MALWLELGNDRRIPVLNREWLSTDEVEKLRGTDEVRVVSEVVSSRKDLRERRYRGTDIQYVLHNLRPDDVVKVKTYPDSYADQEVTVTKKRSEEVEAENNRGGFHLLPRYWGTRNQGEGQPWLRTKEGYDSRGEICEVEVLRLAEDGE